jgi:tetratricopeptide (TPR) repeat protein
MQFHRTWARSDLSSLILCATLLGLPAPPVRADDLSDVQQLLKASNAADALKRADQFLATHPKDAQMRFLKGVALAEQNRATEAVTVFVKITEDFPELPEPYNNLAVLYANQGHYDKARTALEMAIRTNPSYATAYENLGDVYAKLASQAYAKALQVDAGNTAVAPKLALIRDLFPSGATAARGTARPVAVAAAKPVPAVPVAAPASAPPAAVPPPAASASAAVAAAAPEAPQAEISSAGQAWAQAWSRKDLDGYFAAYTPHYTGGQSRDAWREDRRSKILGKSRIKVHITDLVITVSGSRATARFRQAYAADSLSVASRKTLTLVRNGDKWLIEKESVGS